MNKTNCNKLWTWIKDENYIIVDKKKIGEIKIRIDKKDYEDYISEELLEECENGNRSECYHHKHIPIITKGEIKRFFEWLELNDFVLFEDEWDNGVELPRINKETFMKKIYEDKELNDIRLCL